MRDVRRILFVDDEYIIRNAFKLALERGGYTPENGYEILMAADGLIAWNICQYQGPIDVLCTDHYMPMMNGLELLEKVGSMVPHTYFTTAGPDPKLLERALQLGAETVAKHPDSFLEKMQELYPRE